MKKILTIFTVGCLVLSIFINIGLSQQPEIGVENTTLACNCGIDYQISSDNGYPTMINPLVIFDLNSLFTKKIINPPAYVSLSSSSFEVPPAILLWFFIKEPECIKISMIDECIYPCSFNW